MNNRQPYVKACMDEIDRYRGGYFNERPWLRQAFGSVPREHFVPDRVWWPDRDADGLYPVLDRTADPERWLQAVYSPSAALITQIADGAVKPEDGPTDCGDFTSSISCAAVVVNMLHHLDPQSGETILEVGTGTGYNTALLAHRVGADRVVTVEIDPTTAEQAAANLHGLDRPAPTVVTGDGERGYPVRAPYDRLISTACVREIPAAWMEQVRAGGIIVTPIATPFGTDALAQLTADGTGHATGRLVTAVDFMFVRSQRAFRPWRELGWPRLPDFQVTAGPNGQEIRQH
ncbi:methyltransferase domain-containing protein [Streptomyces violascens]|uniref:methyltransferase domain-containing protein n=1 Tax=Streptomyces violascens TaxID=67381 RepID=UPI0036870ACD